MRLDLPFDLSRTTSPGGLKPATGPFGFKMVLGRLRQLPVFGFHRLLHWYTTRLASRYDVSSGQDAERMAG